MPLWLALVFRGARAGGLRESVSLNFELGCGTILAPDTASGRMEEESCKQLLKENHFRLVNLYLKLIFSTIRFEIYLAQPQEKRGQK